MKSIRSWFWLGLFMMAFIRYPQAIATLLTPTYLGSAHAGWFIPQELLFPGAICYCFGAGQDITFDIALAEKYECQVYCFDPAPESIAYVNDVQASVESADTFIAYPKDPTVWERFHFFPFGLWITDTTVPFFEPAMPKFLSHSLVNHHQSEHFFEAEVKQLSTIMHELGHAHIDLLKLDIEGAEYQVIKNMLAAGIYPAIICLEFHPVSSWTKKQVIDDLEKNGYRAWFIHKNRDYTFVLKSPQEQFRDGKMQLHEFFIDLFSRAKVTTEYYAYKLLKEKPLAVPSNYVAVPWAQLINLKQLDRMPKIKFNGGFTICQHIDFLKIVPLLQEMGIDVLFTPHITKKIKIDGMTIMPFPHMAVNGSNPAATKDILYSFIGASTHTIRRQLFAMHHPSNTVIIKRKEWHFYSSPEKQERERKEYQDALARSRFSLCPRGTGPSTIRFWESLQAGAIPVVFVGREEDAMMLPPGFDWDSCVLFVAENEITHLAEKIAAIPRQQEIDMREQCLRCYEQFSGKHFVSVIRDYYEW